VSEEQKPNLSTELHISIPRCDV